MTTLSCYPSRGDGSARIAAPSGPLRWLVSLMGRGGPSCIMGKSTCRADFALLKKAFSLATGFGHFRRAQGGRAGRQGRYGHRRTAAFAASIVIQIVSDVFSPHLLHGDFKRNPCERLTKRSSSSHSDSPIASKSWREKGVICCPVVVTYSVPHFFVLFRKGRHTGSCSNRIWRSAV